MKKILLFSFFVLAFFCADANPLFFPHCSQILVRDDYWFFYDSYGNLIGREQVGESGYIHWYNAGQWIEEGYFIAEGDWCYYYDNNGNYLGRERDWFERYEEIYSTGTYYRQTVHYVSAKNRPVATYRQINVGSFGKNTGALMDALEAIVNPLGFLQRGGGSSTRRLLQLQGQVRFD